jgi:hypothetical protein
MNFGNLAELSIIDKVSMYIGAAIHDFEHPFF